MTDLPGLLLLGLRFGLAICLYGFFFWAIRILWKSLQSSAPAEHKLLTPLILTITTEDEVGTHTLIDSENLIGRAVECTIHVTNSTVSNQHARIYFSQGHWWIEDMNSSNGTYLNGIQIDQPAVLADQDALGLGSLNVVIQIPSLKTSNS